MRIDGAASSSFFSLIFFAGCSCRKDVRDFWVVQNLLKRAADRERERERSDLIILFFFLVFFFYLIFIYLF